MSEFVGGQAVRNATMAGPESSQPEPSVPDALDREIEFLDGLLDEVILEQEDRELLDRITAVRLGEPGAAPDGQSDETGGLIRAFGLFFQLANLAEERHRLRTLRRRQQRSPEGVVKD